MVKITTCGYSHKFWNSLLAAQQGGHKLASPCFKTRVGLDRCHCRRPSGRPPGNRPPTPKPVPAAVAMQCCPAPRPSAPVHPAFANTNLAWRCTVGSLYDAALPCLSSLVPPAPMGVPWPMTSPSANLPSVRPRRDAPIPSLLSLPSTPPSTPHHRPTLRPSEAPRDHRSLSRFQRRLPRAMSPTLSE